MSDFIIAKSGEHFVYNPLGCSAEFYETVSFLEHFHFSASCSPLETAFAPQVCLFQCALWLLVPNPVF